MKAVLLAGGEESLQNPLSKFSVKALLPVGNRPVLWYLLRLLQKNNINDILISAGHSTQLIEDEFVNVQDLGVNVRFLEDDFPRGPAGCLVPQKEFIGDSSFVVLSPVYPGNLDLENLLKRHRESGNMATVAVSRLKQGARGCFETDSSMRIVGYVDSPTPKEQKSLFQPLGLYVFEPGVLDFISDESYMDIKEQLIPTLIEENQTVRACLVAEDVNKLENVNEYFAANQSIFTKENGLDQLGKELSPGVFVRSETEIAAGAGLSGPLLIGEGTTIEEESILVGPAVIGDNCLISKGSRIKESILWSGTQLGDGAEMEHSISCRNTKIKPGATIRNTLVNGKKLHFGELALAGTYFAPLKLESQVKGRGQVYGLLNAFFKRAMDLLISAVGLIVCAIPLLFIAAAIKLDSPGPIFYSQIRRTKGGRKFFMIKFRSMVIDADKMIDEMQEINQSDGPMFKIKKDPRLTRMGKFLRQTSLDELPQLFNVLKGDMSLVGPRPLAMHEMKWSPRWRDIRLQVKPGITGIWQIKGRSNSQFHDWIESDIDYVKNQSIGLDIKILIKTVLSVCRGTGAY